VVVGEDVTMGWKQVVALGSLAGLIVACSGTAAAPPEPIRTFGPSDTPITASGISADDGGWRIDRTGTGSVPLFEVPAQRLESTMLTYRAHMKASDVAGKAYLEMWVRVPGRGEFFSRGLAQPLSGTSGWASYEIPFFLNEKGATADLVKLNVAFEGGGGTVWIKDVELLKASLAG
jgi:hypothetical protein